MNKMETTYILIKKPEWDKIASEFNSSELPSVTEIHIDKTIKERATEAASKYKWNNERDGKFYIECFIEGAKQKEVIEQLKAKNKQIIDLDKSKTEHEILRVVGESRKDFYENGFDKNSESEPNY